ncbi:MAG: hypothetical protein J0651_01540 [Actinobacteria bacterium]|jgi:hypothetical protein|nr:hypothetical protein [Actinomycetota bacterium]
METTATTQPKTTSDYLNQLAHEAQLGAQATYEDIKRSLASFDPQVNEFTATYLAQQAVQLLKAAERAHTLRGAAMALEGI